MRDDNDGGDSQHGHFYLVCDKTGRKNDSLLIFIAV